MTSVLLGMWQRAARRIWQAHPDLVAGLVVLAVAVPSRLLFLGSDPPGDVQKHFLWDEGLWAHNARVHELLGVWIADDHNPPLVLTPLYTAALTAAYRLFGFGLVPTRLVSAASGILTCLLLYWAVRAVRPPARSLLAALVFTLSYFVATHHRVAFTEAHQLLWIVLGVGGTLWAVRSSRWALLGGLGIALSQLVKPSALVLLPAVVGFWLWRKRPVADDPGGRSFRWAEAWWFAAGLGVVAAPVLIIVLSSWSFVWSYFAVSLRSAGTLSHTPHVDLIAGAFRLPPTGLVLQATTQIVAVGILAWSRLVQPKGGRPDAVERFAWLWLAIGLLSIGFLTYQPDRRFLLLTAPVAILFASAMDPRAPGSGRPQPGPTGALRRFAGGAVLGFAIGWVAVALGLRQVSGVPPSSWSLLWGLATAGGGLGSMLLPPRALQRAAAIPLTILIPLFLILEPARFAAHLLQPRYSVLDAAKSLAVLTQDLRREDRVLVGIGGPTLTLESEVLAITERRDQITGALMNTDAWDRYKPALALEAIHRGESHAEGGEARRRGFQPCRTFEILPDERGVPFRRYELWIRPDLASRCRPPDKR